MLQQLREQYENTDCRDLGSRQLEKLRDGLKCIAPSEINNLNDGKAYIELLKKFREAIAENDKLHGENYPKLLKSILSVGEDGLYSNNLRFIFELIQNVDDCDYLTADDCRLDMHFDINNGVITLTYNEVGFTPFNVFAITGIAEAAKNVSATKNEIGEKGIGFKSVFGVANKVLIRSGWFSFELYKENFTVPVPCYSSAEYCHGTQMKLYVPGGARRIYSELKNQYCRKDALFSKNPLLFLNKLTELKMYFDSVRSMEFHVSRSDFCGENKVEIERNVEISVKLNDHENGMNTNINEQIHCSRYSYPVLFSKEACKSRYGSQTLVGGENGKSMVLRVLVPDLEYLNDIGMGALYSFLPTQLKLTVPLVCHVPFKLDASREFVDPQGENLWFMEASKYLSDLMDFVYTDWKTVVKENIIQYLPGARESLFSRNNGKEQCLSKQKVFLGMHYLDMPILLATDGEFHKADDIFCFEHEEHIADPQKVHMLMGYKKALFIPSGPVSKFYLQTEKNINKRLFRRALAYPSMTDAILDYLDSIEYTYTEDDFRDQEFALTADQVLVVFCHDKLAKLLQNIGCDYIKKNMRPKWLIKENKKKDLSDMLYGDFELSESSKTVEKYLRCCDEKCICLDIGETEFLPCYNGIVISENNTLSSFAAFCYSVDKSDTVFVRIRIREASKTLNRYVADDSISPSDYLKKLREVRLLIKESLGQNGYRNYIDLILKSGVDRNRFVQEILQNADDCNYMPDVTPTFSLTQKGNRIIAEYNEVGFTRDNIRSITAIGESTKKRLISGQYATIGEKGVGFKTIFAVASEVKIHSGEYAFSLRDREPTIPKSEPVNDEPVQGTIMEVILKNDRAFPSFNDKAILELCLCLRNLKKINIGAHSVTIEDSGDNRTITIDNKRKHVFRRYTHKFQITDEKALEDRQNGGRAISSEQTIVCFVPEKSGNSDYPLYNGLPTKHRIKIPMVIDAPFALTTSREEIENENSQWNNIVRNEMYLAILEVVNLLKMEERAKIFRFTRFLWRVMGNNSAYIAEITDSPYLNEYDYLGMLKSSEILPLFDKTIFAVPQHKTAYRFPDAANYIFRRVSSSEYAGISPSSVIDVDTKDYEATLNALDCELASFDKAFPVIEMHAERFVRDADFRQKLYGFLQSAPSGYQSRIRALSIIPVYGKTSGSVEYISWKDDSIFVKREADISSSDYFVLNERLLEKSVCERMLQANINEMNKEYERTRYNERLKRIIYSSVDPVRIYDFLMSEFKNGSIQRNNSFDVLYAIVEKIPMKNEIGEIICAPMFLCNQPSGYFPTQMIQKMIVHKECAEFAKYLRFEDLENIHYEDIDYSGNLIDDDVETLMDDYFINSDEILQGFYRDNLLSDELLTEYDLDYLALGRVDDDNEIYDFPSIPVGNRNQIREHVRKLWNNPVEVVSVKVERTVRRGKKPDGTEFDLDINDSRDGALHVYTPEGTRNHCFCQMCHRLKPYRLIEVNNIEKLPTHYFSQLRIALCLECSKKFEYYRDNEAIRTSFANRIKTTTILPNNGTVDVKISGEEKITFTAKHLAEVQEILLQKPKK